MKKITFAFILISSFYACQNKPCGFKNGLQEGTCKFFYNDGKLKEISNWDNGKLEGHTTYYYPNEVKKAEGEYKRGFKNKKWTYYREDGSMSSVETFLYKNNLSKLEGENTFYYPTGQVEEKGFYKNGLATGRWQGFHKNGKLFAEVNIVEGKREGERKTYRQDGTLDKIEIYRNGKRISAK